MSRVAEILNEYSEQLHRVNYIMSLRDKEASEQSRTCAITKQLQLKVKQWVTSWFRLVKNNFTLELRKKVMTAVFQQARL